MIGGAGGREFCVPVRNARGKDKSEAGVKRKRKCPNCSQFGVEHMYECGGQGGGAARCDYFDLAGRRRCYNCDNMKEKGKSDHDPHKCLATKNRRDDCPYIKWNARNGSVGDNVNMV